MAAVILPVSIVGLIFGGCCSNVFALEGIIRSEPGSGLLITFLQFAFISVTALPAPLLTAGGQNNGKGSVPMTRWAYIAFLFYSINMLNNWAFAFNISVPVHIILRSFGSVTTMLAGVVRGKRYSKLQVSSVVILTFGVLVSAWADSMSKGKSMKVESSASSTEFTTGLAILLVAQTLSAYMGAYVEDTYAAYGASWTENLFYSHFLALPLFLPLWETLSSQWDRLAKTPALDLRAYKPHAGVTGLTTTDTIVAQVLTGAESMPQGMVYLLLNACAQLVHFGSEPAFGQIIRRYCDNCAQHPKARELHSEHVDLWAPPEPYDDVGLCVGLWKRSSVWVGDELEVAE